MTTINITLPKPHSPQQGLIFDALRTKGITETWVACGTKVGKTLGGSIALCTQFPIKRQSIWRWVAPIYPQATIGLRYISRMLPPRPFVETYQYKIKIPALESAIEFRSGEKPENLEGEAVAGYVLDECSKMKPEVYSSAKTTLTFTQGPLLALSTPRGKNWFYNKCMEAKEEMEWAFQKGIPPTRLFVTAPTSINPNVKPKVIEDGRRDFPDRLFRQYFMAEFIEDSSTFMGFRDCYFTEPLPLEGEHQIWFAPEASKSQVVIGVDWAKTIDWTVFIAINIVSRKVVAFERFHKTKYTDAIRQLVRFSRKFKDVLVVYHDKTGVGQAIDDQLSYTDLEYQGVNFTDRSKANMVNGLITAVESKAIGLPFWNVLDLEMDAFEVTTNDLGTMHYSAPSGKHDDTVMALCLANAALERYSDREYDVKFIEELKADSAGKLSPLEQFYRDDD